MAALGLAARLPVRKTPNKIGRCFINWRDKQTYTDGVYEPPMLLEVGLPYVSR